MATPSEAAVIYGCPIPNAFALKGRDLIPNAFALKGRDLEDGEKSSF
jgi:hypothetical protein